MKIICAHLTRPVMAFLLFGLALACKPTDDTTPKSSEKEITSFAFTTPAATAQVDKAAGTITAALPIGTNAAALAPTIGVSGKATVSPASGSTQDFTKAVEYTVTAEDGSTKRYTATMTVIKATGRDLLTLVFAALPTAVSCTVDQATKVVSGTLPVGTNATALVPTLTISDRATVSPASGVAQDFTKTVTYTVTAEDGATQAYTTSLTVLAPPSVSTGTATGITSAGFAMGGSIVATGTSAISQYGHYYSSTNATPGVGDPSTMLGAATGPRTFNSDITGLGANTLYYVRAYAVSAVGRSLGAVVQVRTSAAAELPTVVTNSAGNILSTSAQLTGTLNRAGTSSVTAYGHCWSSTDQTPTINNAKTTLTASGNYPLGFTSNLSSLSANTTYYVRAYATSAAGTAYSSAITFKTANTTDDLLEIKDIEFVLQRGTPYSADAQPCLLNLSTGKVYTFGEGTANATNVDVVINTYSSRIGSDDVQMFPPSKLLDLGEFWGDLAKKLVAKNWSIYKATKLSYLNETTYPATTGWGKINTATDLSNVIKNTFISLTATDFPLMRQTGDVLDSRLFVFQTREGKQGMLRITDGQKKTTSFTVKIDIKVQK